MIHELDIPQELIVQAPTTDTHKNYGKNCFLAHTAYLETSLLYKYKRKGLCLKVFTGRVPKDPSRFLWGGAPLVETTKVQNIFAWYGLAPRVYDVVLLPTGQLAQVTDWATGKGKPDMHKARKLIDSYRIEAVRKDAKEYVSIPFKWVGDKFVDFGRFQFGDPKWYERKLKAKVQRRRRGPNMSLVGYQEFAALGVPGQRNHEHRLRRLRLDEIDFRGKTVLDIGCNAGAMCREAVERGAARVVGVDFKDCRLWFELNNWIGCWNIDFLELSLPKQWEQIRTRTDLWDFDVVFALAIFQHVKGGLPSWVVDLTHEVFLFEGNWKVPPKKYVPTLEEWFPTVEMTGYIKDEDKRAQFRCWVTSPKAPQPLPAKDPDRRTIAIGNGRTAFGRVMLKRNELGFLYDLAKQAPEGLAVEVGVADGASLVCWTAGRPTRLAFTYVDIEESDALSYNLRAHDLIPAEGYVGDSFAVSALLPDRLAFCFIDADHTKKGISRDLKVYPQKLKPGGILVFHDYDSQEDKRGKGYVVYKCVSSWWADNPEWKFLGAVGRVAAFRRPDVVPSVEDSPVLSGEDEQGCERERVLPSAQCDDRVGSVRQVQQAEPLLEGVQEDTEPGGDEGPEAVQVGDLNSC